VAVIVLGPESSILDAQLAVSIVVNVAVHI
jgi:hypothetical protein